MSWEQAYFTTFPRSTIHFSWVVIASNAELCECVSPLDSSFVAMTRAWREAIPNRELSKSRDKRVNRSRLFVSRGDGIDKYSLISSWWDFLGYCYWEKLKSRFKGNISIAGCVKFTHARSKHPLMTWRKRQRWREGRGLLGNQWKMSEFFVFKYALAKRKAQYQLLQNPPLGRCHHPYCNLARIVVGADSWALPF